MDDNVIEMLTKWSKADEIWEVRTFRGYRNGVEIVMNVLDSGPAAGSNRYMVEAYDAHLDGEERHSGSPSYSLGNPDGDIEAAVANVHWNQIGAVKDR